MKLVDQGLSSLSPSSRPVSAELSLERESLVRPIALGDFLILVFSQAHQTFDVSSPAQSALFIALPFNYQLSLGV